MTEILPAAPAAVDAPVASVTLFEDRAEVERLGRLTLPPGVHRVVVPGISPFVADRSLAADLPEGGGRVLSTRVVRRVRPVPALDGDAVERLEREVEDLAVEVAAADRAGARAIGARARCDALFGTWDSALGRVPKGSAEALEAWDRAHGGIIEALDGALDAGAGAREAGEDARERLGLAVARLAQGRCRQPRFEAAVEVVVEVAGPGCALRLRYRTPCALWRPEHRAVLHHGDGRSEVEITTFAAAWQATGEAWSGVPVRFSTARPARHAVPPLLADDVLQRGRKADRLVVEARDQAVQAAGLERGTRPVDEMPGVDDGGEPVAWEAPRPATLPSDGRPVRVEIGSVRLPCEVALAAWPEVAGVAHVRATATLAGTSAPLLAGPVRVVRGGEACGTGRIGFVAPGEPFEIGFGPEAAVRVRRRVEERHDTTPVIGTRKVRRTITLHLSNLGDRPRSVEVRERVPVSEVASVDVRLEDPGGGRFDPTDGFLVFHVDLPPDGTREIGYTWRLSAPEKVTLPF